MDRERHIQALRRSLRGGKSLVSQDPVSPCTQVQTSGAASPAHSMQVCCLLLGCLSESEPRVLVCLTVRDTDVGSVPATVPDMALQSKHMFSHTHTEMWVFFSCEVGAQCTLRVHCPVSLKSLWGSGGACAKRLWRREDAGACPSGFSDVLGSSWACSPASGFSVALVVFPWNVWAGQ